MTDAEATAAGYALAFATFVAIGAASKTRQTTQRNTAIAMAGLAAVSVFGGLPMVPIPEFIRGMLGIWVKAAGTSALVHEARAVLIYCWNNSWLAATRPGVTR